MKDTASEYLCPVDISIFSASLFHKFMSLYTHSSRGRKNQWSEGSFFHLQDTCIVFPLLLLFVGEIHLMDRFGCIGRSWSVEHSYVKKCPFQTDLAEMSSRAWSPIIVPDGSCWPLVGKRSGSVWISLHFAVFITCATESLSQLCLMVTNPQAYKSVHDY